MSAKYIFVIYSLFLACCAGPRKEHTEIVVHPPKEEKTAEAPQPTTKKTETKSTPQPSSLMVLDKKYFVVHFDPSYRLAKYVKYSVTAEQLRHRLAKRRNRFKADPELTGELRVHPKEYTHTGYNRGHLAPSADFAFSQEANDLTFLMSNMVPQKPRLNQDAWKRLEDKVRRWACGEERVTVITGPILEEKLDRLPSGLPVPKQFFKIIIDETPPRKAAAFIYNQSDRGDVLRERMVRLQDLMERIRENFAADIGEPVRQPSQLNEWKEDDC